MAFQIQVKGEWAGGVGNTWRPAIDGTLNQTGRPRDEASTFDTIEDARTVHENVVLPELPAAGEEDYSHNRPRFRIVDLDTGDYETR